MKTSQKSLAFTLGAILLGLLLLVAGTRLALSNYTVAADEQAASGAAVAARSMPLEQLTDFSRVEISGTANVTITHGDHWAVEIEAEPAKRDMLSAYVEGDRLILASDNNKLQQGWGWLSGNGVPFSARITMPDIAGVSASGRIALILEDFDQASLNIELSGTCSMEGERSKFGDLKLIASGANNFDFSGVSVTNADVTGSGASNIVLHMAGGVLSGTLSGVGNVEYTGEASENSLQLSSMGRLTEK